MLVTEPDLDCPVRPGGGEGVSGEDAVGADPAGGAGEAGRQAERGAAEGAPALPGPGPHQPSPHHHQTKLCNSATKRAECLRLSGPLRRNCILHWQSGTFWENSARLRTTAEHGRTGGFQSHSPSKKKFANKILVWRRTRWRGGQITSSAFPPPLSL